MADRLRPTRVLSWWVGFLLVLLVLGAGASYVYVVGFLLGPDNQNSRVLTDALRMGLLVVAALGGLVALLLAARAQWLRERRQRHRELTEADTREHEERVHAHEERITSVQQRQTEQMARAGEADATERRGVELVMRAIDQLGGADPTVRQGALAVLERLAQNAPDHRQVVVDVICGYLRLPADLDPRLPERVVRQSAQRVLLRHLSPEDRRVQWRGVHLDLSGAVLTDFDATGCVLSSVDFAGTSFLGATSFADCIFDATARFTGTHFGGTSATFRGARFASAMSFERITFGCPVDFALAEFTQAVGFERALFDADANFAGARFGNTIQIRDVDFGGPVSFQGVAFENDIVLVRTMFRSSVTFVESTLDGHSWFEEVRASRAAPHAFPPGYREVPIDGAWFVLEHEQADQPPVNSPPPRHTNAQPLDPQPSNPQSANPQSASVQPASARSSSGQAPNPHPPNAQPAGARPAGGRRPKPAVPPEDPDDSAEDDVPEPDGKADSAESARSLET